MEYTDEYINVLIEDLQKYEKYQYEPVEKIRNKFRTIDNLKAELRTLRAIERQHELIEVLKTTDKYQGLTTQEIEDMFDTIDELRNEVADVIKQEHEENEYKYKLGTHQDIYNKILFNTNKDVGYNILLNMNIKDLNKYCQINSTVQHTICKDPNFWAQKMKHDGFDYNIYTETRISNYLDLIQYYNSKSLSSYFQIYNNIALSKKYAEHILKIAEIENKDVSDFRYFNRIVIKGSKKLILLIISSFLDTNNFTKMYNNISKNEIRILYSTGKYINVCSAYVVAGTSGNNNDVIDVVGYNGVADFVDIKKLLMRAIYYQLAYENINIVDNNNKSYIINNPQAIDIDSKRYGMSQAFDNCR